MDTCPKCGEALAVGEFYEAGGKTWASLLCGDYVEVMQPTTSLPEKTEKERRHEDLATAVDRVKQGKAHPLSLRRHIAPRGEGKTAAQLLRERTEAQNG